MVSKIRSGVSKKEEERVMAFEALTWLFPLWQEDANIKKATPEIGAAFFSFSICFLCI